jgi:hypothetical protein
LFLSIPLKHPLIYDEGKKKSINQETHISFTKRKIQHCSFDSVDCKKNKWGFMPIIFDEENNPPII